MACSLHSSTGQSPERGKNLLYTHLYKFHSSSDTFAVKASKMSLDVLRSIASNFDPDTDNATLWDRVKSLQPASRETRTIGK